MTMWPSRTKAWNGKTKPVNLPHVKTLEKEKEEFIDELDEIAALKAKIVLLETSLKEKDCEIKRILIKLDDNTTFLQDVVMDLIKLKTYIPSSAIATPSPKTRLEEYIAKKNSTAVAK